MSHDEYESATLEVVAKMWGTAWTLVHPTTTLARAGRSTPSKLVEYGAKLVNEFTNSSLSSRSASYDAEA